MSTPSSPSTRSPWEARPSSSTSSSFASPWPSRSGRRKPWRPIWAASSKPVKLSALGVRPGNSHALASRKVPLRAPASPAQSVRGEVPEGGRSPPPGYLAAEEPLEEVLHVLGGIGRAALGLLPGALGLRLHFLGRVLDFLTGDLGAFHHRVADTLGCFLDALTGLLGAGLDPLRGLVHLARIGGLLVRDLLVGILGPGGRREPGQEHGGQDRDQPDQLSVHGFPPSRATRVTAGRRRYYQYSIPARSSGRAGGDPR